MKYILIVFFSLASLYSFNAFGDQENKCINALSGLSYSSPNVPQPWRNRDSLHGQIALAQHIIAYLRYLACIEEDETVTEQKKQDIRDYIERLKSEWKLF